MKENLPFPPPPSLPPAPPPPPPSPLPPPQPLANDKDTPSDSPSAAATSGTLRRRRACNEKLVGEKLEKKTNRRGRLKSKRSSRYKKDHEVISESDEEDERWYHSGAMAILVAWVLLAIVLEAHHYAVIFISIIFALMAFVFRY